MREGAATSAEERKGVVPDGLGPEELKKSLVRDGLEKVTEDDEPLFLKLSIPAGWHPSTRAELESRETPYVFPYILKRT